jgi:hypothetical protein
VNVELMSESLVNVELMSEPVVNVDLGRKIQIVSFSKS